MPTHSFRRPFLYGVSLLLLLSVVPMSSQAASAKQPNATRTLAIKTLSNRADLISGGDALTQIVLPTGAKVSGLRVRLDGKNVTREFALRRNHKVEGRLTGLVLGTNTVIATSNGERARLVITNHPLGGPDFSGPQIKPWKCETGAKNRKCDIAPTFALMYLPAGTEGTGVGVSGVASASTFLPYNPKSPPAAALIATTTTRDGVTMPFIIRQETGYIDRDQYTIATLYQPGKPWQPWAAQRQFNHRLVITHGASCDTTYGSGAAPSVLNPTLLGAGFILMSNALDNAGHNCNLVTEAESLVMTKEYVIDHYGQIRWTIGSGCSGGSLVQQQVANAYPGLYQGITPQCSFTDAWSSSMEYVDYGMLLRYFENPSKWAPGAAWTPTAIQQAIDHPNIGNPVTFTTVIPNSANPSRSCPDVPKAKTYDPKTNPKGVKCDLQDYMVNVFGKRKDGFANRPFGNDGIQYGLQGLLNGEISPAAFVDLNTKVGGLTKNDTYQAKRSKPNLIGLKRAYLSGAVDSANHLNKVAIIDLRGPDPGFFHDVYRTYAMRARLLRDFGTAANQVLWRGEAPIAGDANYANQAVFAMDTWLARVHADHRRVPLATKIIQDKQLALTNRCTDGSGNALPAESCDETVQAYGTPRMAAGMPETDDVLECRLQPLHRSAYPVTFTPAEWKALRTTFPQGVCNYNKRGVDQRGAISWLTYQTKSGHVIYGGKPMGKAPSSALLKR